jgi:hypothetical protein
MGTPANHTHVRRRPQTRRYRESFIQRYKTWILSIAGIALFGGLLAIAIVESTGSSDNSNTSAVTSTPLDANVAASLASVPASTSTTVGDGNSSNPPQSIDGTAISSDGKPEVLYVGAEFCPFCAAERWPLMLALSRFGTFSNLQSSASAADDAYPNTPTLSFYGSSYDSPYLAFTPVEQYTNERVNGSYAPLQSLTSEQQKIVNEYNEGGGIPYLYLNGQYEVSGANYNPNVLAGMTVEQVAAAIQDPSTPQSKAIIGSANVLTASICQVTGGQPGNVCNSPEVVQASMQLQ